METNNECGRALVRLFHERPSRIQAAQGSCQARRPSTPLDADIVSFVYRHLRTRALETRARGGVAVKHEAAPRRNGEHVRAHALELPVRHFHERDATIQQLL